MDGTHIKANANIKKVVKKEVPVAAKRYAEELVEEVNADREAHGKKSFADDTEDVDSNDSLPTPPKKKRDNTSKKKLKKRKRKQRKGSIEEGCYQKYHRPGLRTVCEGRAQETACV